MKIVFLVMFVLLSSCSVFSQDYYYGMVEPGKIGLDAGFSFDRLNTKVQTNKIIVESATVEYNDNMLPEITLGVGVINGLELGVDVSYRSATASALLKIAKREPLGLSGKGSGLDAVTAYGKIGLTREYKSLPSFVIETDFIIPGTGAKLFRSDNFGFIPQLQMFKTLSSSTDVSAYISAGWDGASPYAVGEFNVAPELYLSDNVNLYAEYTGTYVNKSGPDNKIDAGIYWTAADCFSLEGFIGTVFGTYFGKRIIGGLLFHFTI